MRYLFLTVLLCSCQQFYPSPPFVDAHYFPLETGLYRIYSVTEQRYLPGKIPIARTYFQREQTGAPFRTLTGDLAFPITYAHRTDSAAVWLVDSVGTAQLTAMDARLTTGSLTIIKLKFPFFDGQRWDGNRFNTLGSDEFRLQHCDKPFRTEGKSYDRTITVVQQEDSTLIGQDKRLEVYALTIGLVYAERQQVRYCASTSGCGQPSAISYGIRQFIRLKAYGKE